MPICSTCGTRYGLTVRICIKDGTPLIAGSVDDPNIGKLLDGKYRVDAFISAGGMGSVYRATHVMLGKTVAVKVIRNELVTSDDVVRRFQREARAASTLDHPNIVTVYDLGQADDGTVYIAMEYIEGRSLKETIRRDGPVPYDLAVDIVRQVTGALAVAHRKQIIHRDLKSQNLMLTTGVDGRLVAKLVDFGIAKTFDEPAQLTAAGFVLGTPHYMSPEQAAGKPVDHRADLYSLGVILYEMLVGDVPFSDASTTSILVKLVTDVPEPPSRRRTDLAVPESLEVIAMKCLEKDPDKRFQSAADVAAALDPATNVRTRALVHAIPSKPRRAWVVAASLAAAMLVAGALAFGMVGPRWSPPEQVPARPAIHAVPQVPLREPTPDPITPPSAPATHLAAGHQAISGAGVARAAPVPTVLPEVAPTPTLPTRPERPPVFVDCNGIVDICATAIAEIVKALQDRELPVVRDARKADVELTATVGLVSEIASLDFGTPLVTRTYSLAVEGTSNGVEIAMPPARTFSFDARFGSARLQENLRVIAGDAAERVLESWLQPQR
ncbi:MAG TPA: protein kinase [Vicinamibacterales bacterium]|jgi:serine/threonine-protein kinase|nr:protein kinase [Vicinamibacterales bacterium]